MAKREAITKKKPRSFPKVKNLEMSYVSKCDY